MKIIRKRPGQAPEVVDIENSQKAMQEQVDGYIECMTISTDCALICNEEGMLYSLPRQEWLGLKWYGTVLMVGVAVDEFTDVPAHLVNRYCFAVQEQQGVEA